MIQIKLTDEQFQDLFNGLFEAEKSLNNLEKSARAFGGAEWLVEESAREALQYKNLREYIKNTREVI